MQVVAKSPVFFKTRNKFTISNIPANPDRQAWRVSRCPKKVFTPATAFLEEKP
jgi:hypothetical protein